MLRGIINRQFLDLVGRWRSMYGGEFFARRRQRQTESAQLLKACELKTLIWNSLLMYFILSSHWHDLTSFFLLCKKHNFSEIRNFFYSTLNDTLFKFLNQYSSTKEPVIKHLVNQLPLNILRTWRVVLSVLYVCL